MNTEKLIMPTEVSHNRRSMTNQLLDLRILRSVPAAPAANNPVNARSGNGVAVFGRAWAVCTGSAEGASAGAGAGSGWTSATVASSPLGSITTRDSLSNSAGLGIATGSG